ncbi:hypothetical protein [Arthrobacter koreensis]|uniref:hypothetical protein n=1 Tax=Arthrobacter koreensis TaxID=199136 RepID=UPI002DC0539B|nr:hypothetical protein [Arthrobacter koreensis]MEB7504982.1 hypothetical protein [Arthrobacter koreensis]
MDPRNHPTVRRGTSWWRYQSVIGSVVLLGLAVLLLREPALMNVLGALACALATGLLIYFSEKQIKALRREYRYEDEDTPHS